jgi:ribonuclease BN (tRNA processing enzyme)
VTHVTVIEGVAVALMASSGALAQSCTGNPVAVQVLGSGAPGFVRDRANTSYLLWVGNQAKILVDAGGGAYVRFGQAQAKFSDLSVILVSHLHPDHSSDLPGVLWSGRNTRNDMLPIVGPSGNEAAPDRDGVKVTAMGIPHGNLPTLAYRVETQGVNVVYSSDQSGTNPRFPDFAKGADILVMHLAIGVGANNPNQALPAVVVKVAQSANPKRLILSHIANFDLDAAVADVKRNYSGPLTIGADLQCTQAK